MIPLRTAEKALRQSVEKMARLIAELHDLRMRVRRAEATALTGRHVAARKSGEAVDDLIGRRPTQQNRC